MTTILTSRTSDDLDTDAASQSKRVNRDLEADDDDDAAISDTGDFVPADRGPYSIRDMDAGNAPFESSCPEIGHFVSEEGGSNRITILDGHLVTGDGDTVCLNTGEFARFEESTSDDDGYRGDTDTPAKSTNKQHKARGIPHIYIVYTR